MLGITKQSSKRIYERHVKRALDFMLSLVAIIILSPLFVIIALLIKIKLGSPVIFKQARPGKDEKIFKLYKFRSMTNAKGNDGRLLPDAERLTKFGKFLRASSIDELPELVNILKGDMSIVGPRPLSVYYLPHYPLEYRRRHEVRPGLTGYAQVNGRNNLDWNDRFEYDITYVDNVSFKFDLKIIFKTIIKVVKRSDVTVRGTNEIMDYGTYSVIKEEGSHIGSMKGNTTYSEIGSYFWLDDQLLSEVESEIVWLPNVADSSFTFSGRNAIDYALRDILDDKDRKTVYVPSYCCISMLQPLIDRGLKTMFYDVFLENGRFIITTPKIERNSIVLIMSYFGLDTQNVRSIIQDLKKNGAIIIEDITHSLLRRDPASEYSDYVVASLRKWFPIPAGGWVGKKNGRLTEKPFIDSNKAVANKINAMQEKYRFITGEINTKEGFLQANATFENDLIHIDKRMKIDDISMSLLKKANVDIVIEQRRKNATVLLDGLQEINDINLPIIDIKEDVPLFIPVFLKPELRNRLRDYLIERGIYCPIHWPEVMGAAAGIRENELSLICDQRYSEKDMRSIVDNIKEWHSTIKR